MSFLYYLLINYMFTVFSIDDVPLLQMGRIKLHPQYTNQLYIYCRLDRWCAFPPPYTNQLYTDCIFDIWHTLIIYGENKKLSNIYQLIMFMAYWTDSVLVLHRLPINCIFALFLIDDVPLLQLGDLDSLHTNYTFIENWAEDVTFLHHIPIN